MSNMPASEMTAHSGVLTPGNVPDNVPARAAPINREAVLKALNLNPADPKTQALVLICERYELDPLLKHLVLIKGNCYITRDGYLAIAHRSGQFDGMEVLDEHETDSHYVAKVSAHRKDMSRPFTYVGRFSKAKDMAKDYGPEMAIKVAEVGALRRAFNVSGVPSEHDIAPEDFDGESRVMPLQSEVSMACRDAGLSDEERHALVGAVTNGRTSSSRDLNVEEAREVVLAARRIKAGTHALDFDNDGMAYVIGVKREAPADDFDRDSLANAIAKLDEEARAELATWWKSQAIPPVRDEALTKAQALVAFDEVARRSQAVTTA